MKQIIYKYDNGSIRNKYYLNHLNQINGLFIGYWNNGNLSWKINYLNGKLLGLNNWYDDNNKPTNIMYNL